MSDAWSAPDSAPAAHAESSFRPLGLLTRVLLGLFSLELLLLVGIDLTNLLMAFAYPDALTSDSPSGGALVALLLASLTGLGMLFVILGALPLWVYWHYRAGQNLQSFGRDGLQYGPLAHAGWWFVPFANLVAPYRTTLELYKASQPDPDPDGWQLGQTPALFGVWWGCWLIGNIIQNISTRMSWYEFDEQIATLVGMASTPFALAALVLYMRWIKAIADAQQQTADKLAQS